MKLLLLGAFLIVLMQKLIIYKDKITITKWEETSKSWAEYDISKLDGPITKYFNRITEIKDDVTVEDFMFHLERHEAIIDYCFCGYLNDVPFKLYLNEVYKDSEESDLEEIELVWEGEIINKDLAMVGYLRGWLSKKRIEEIGEQFDEPLDISFMPLPMWKKCRLSLNESMMISDYGEIDNIEQNVIYEGFCRWTLFEVISNFLCEISLAGNPDEVRKLHSELQTRKFDKQEVASNEEKTRFWLNFLEMELKDMKYTMEVALDNEEYEAASKLKKEIEIVETDLAELRSEIKKNNPE